MAERKVVVGLFLLAVLLRGWCTVFPGWPKLGGLLISVLGKWGRVGVQFSGSRTSESAHWAMTLMGILPGSCCAICVNAREVLLNPLGGCLGRLRSLGVHCVTRVWLGCGYGMWHRLSLCGSLPLRGRLWPLLSWLR